jgi:hypothetical protein
VDKVQVDLVDAEPSQALLGFGNGIGAPWIELGRDKHVLARHTTLSQRPSDALASERPRRHNGVTESSSRRRPAAASLLRLLLVSHQQAQYG